MTYLEKVFTPFVGFVLSNTDLDYDNFRIYDLNDFDERRIYVALDDGEYSYCIRTWNISRRGIDFTLYDETGEEAEDILHGFYPTAPLQSCLYRYSS